MSSHAFLQISAELQSIEEVPHDLLFSPSSQRPVCSTHARYSECCYNTLQTHFSLPVPLSATQTFNTNCGMCPHLSAIHLTDCLSLSAVSVKWQIHFEFIIKRKSTQPDDLATPTVVSQATVLTLNSSLTDTMTWDLPIIILPTVSEHSDERINIHTVTI